MGMWFLLIPEHPWDEVDRFPTGSSAIRKKKTDLKRGEKKGNNQQIKWKNPTTDNYHMEKQSCNLGVSKGKSQQVAPRIYFPFFL